MSEKSSEAIIRELRDEWEDRLTPRTLTMYEIHIPPQVRDALRAAAGGCDCDKCTDIAITAALRAWMESGMAKPAFGYYSEYLVERGWGIFTETETPQTESVLIIRTKEAT